MLALPTHAFTSDDNRFSSLHNAIKQNLCRRQSSHSVELRNIMENEEYWSGSLDPDDPDNFWIDDETDERIQAE